MAPIVNQKYLRQVLTTSMEMRTKEIQDLVFSANPVTAILRKNDMFKPYHGADIRVPLMIDTLGAQWFTGYDKLDASPKEIINSAVFTPKNVAVGFSLTGTEMLANEGAGQIVDLLEQYQDNAEQSMGNEMELALHGDGTDGGGRSLIGLGAALPIVPNTGVYGGIDRGSVSMWRPNYFNANTDFTSINVTGWDVSTAPKIIRNILARRSKGNQKADLIICDINSYETLQSSLTAIQRITSSEVAKLGFDALELATPAGTVALLCANGVGTVMPENTIYGIDSSSLTMYYHLSRNMVPLFDGDGARPINQDAIVQYLVWNGQLVLKNPRYSWRLSTAAA
ncbi:MAG: phage major capsid protein [Acetobacter sp.]|uniref:phage major capsid protein n=1 Tax=Acetobacter sp. TaxID=440 RepID=UPI0039EC06C4